MRSKVTLDSRISKLTREAQLTAPRLVEEVTTQMADEAAQRAPHDSGDLQESIRAIPHEGGGAVIADIPWRQVEFGTTKMGARPFMVPVAESHGTGFLRRIRELFT